jgi:hypothetical protein
MGSKKQVWELFTKDDPWLLRLLVFVVWLIFLLGLVALLKEWAAPLWLLLIR